MDKNSVDQIYDEDFLLYVKKFCYSKINFQNHDGDDAVQGAVLQIFTNRHKYESRANCTFRTWALTVARNYCLDFVRKQQSLDKKLVRMDDLEPWIAERIGCTEAVDPIEDEQELRLLNKKTKTNLENLNRFLGDVPKEHRNVILLKHELGIMKASRILNMKPSAVKAISLRVLGRLRKDMLNKKKFKSHLARVTKSVGMERFRARRAEFKKVKEEKKLATLKRITDMEEVLQNYNWD